MARRGAAAEAAAPPSCREEALAQRLADTSLEMGVRARAALDVRDAVDKGEKDGLNLGNFATFILPAIMGVLEHGEVSLVAGSNEHRFRHTLLEALQRIPQPHPEAIKEHATALTDVLRGLCRTENEDNVVLSMKIIIDLHRSYKEHLEPQVDAFLDVVKGMYSGMPDLVRDVFDQPTSPNAGDTPAADAEMSVDTPASTVPPTPSAGTAPPKPVILPTGARSFKVVTECPIAIVFLFQSHKDLVRREMPIFIPLIFAFLELQPEAQKEAQRRAAETGEGFSGIAPALVSKRSQFNDLLVAQVKTISFLAYVLRVAQSDLALFRDTIPRIVIRMLIDIPPEATLNRKELLVANRHILSTDFRVAFAPHVRQLLDENVQLGRGTTAREQLVPLAYSTVADLIHHVRAELSTADLSEVIHVYSCKLFDATLQPAIHTMCCKLLLNLVESIVGSDRDRDVAAGLLNRINEAFVRKLEGMAATRNEWPRWLRPSKKRIAAPAVEAADGAAPVEPPRVEMDEVDVARARPIATPAALSEQHLNDPAKTMVEVKFMFKTLLFGCRTINNSLKHLAVSPADASLYGRYFRASIRCLVFYDGRREGRELKEIIDGLCEVFTKADLLVFQEVFETSMPFYLDELLVNHELLTIPQHLLTNAEVSQAFLGILFRFLVGQLERLASESKDFSTVVLRLFKMACMAVTIFPDANEPVLQPHLGKIIMDSLKLASKAKEPASYYLLLRSLFRSIGGGRFELLYKEVLPLLQTLLENLNGLIASAERGRRDLFVELCLTVPVRLSVLLPYLTYLMKPLVFALQATPDLISQGLRTLELCVDNLTQEFLNPLLAPVRQDVMAALWKLLRPVPFNHQHAHTTMRILGKIGGRNRRSLTPSRLEWRIVGDEALMPIRFEGAEEPIGGAGEQPKGVRMAPMVELAGRMFRGGSAHYRRNAWLYLQHAAVVFLRDTMPAGESEDVFGQVIRGLFDATRPSEFADEAETYLRQLARYVFAVELTRELPESGVSKQAFPLSSTFIEAMTESLASADDHLAHVADQVTNILNDLLHFKPDGAAEDGTDGAKEETSGGDAEMATGGAASATATANNALPLVIMHQLANKFSSLCYESSWHRKTGGAAGISIITRRLEPNQHGLDWIRIHDNSLVRALLFMLKDMPGDPPGSVPEVQETLYHVLRLLHRAPAGGETAEAAESRRKRLDYLITLIIPDLGSQVATVRETTQRAFEVVSETTGVTLYDLLRPARDRLVGPIFTKPLRALGFSMQVGFIDAITYCISLEPPLIDFEWAIQNRVGERAPLDPVSAQLENSLHRLIQDALSIADTDDASLGRNANQLKSANMITQLRIVCVRLLAAALAPSGRMIAAEVAAAATPSEPGRSESSAASAQLHPMRHKTLQVYFKLLYSRSPEVADAVSKCLKAMLTDLGKLPKELLQSALKPVLLNLAEAKSLSVGNLGGLGRLLELLSSYFKVEIGIKLLVHFRTLSSDVGALTRSALNPQDDRGELPVMYALVDIFRLLPYPGSEQFLLELVPLVIETETMLKKDGPTPFTKPLAGYLNRYPAETIKFFQRRLEDDVGAARTFMAVMDSEAAPDLREFLGQSDNIEQLMRILLGPDPRRAPVPNEGGSADGTAGELLPWRGALHAAQLIRILVKHDEDWLMDHRKPVVQNMINRWISKARRDRLLSKGQAHLDQLAEDDVTLEVWFAYLELAQNPSETDFEPIDLVFHIVDVFVWSSPTDRTAASAFLFRHVIATKNVGLKKRILARFFDIFTSTAVTAQHKTAALRHVINPMLMVAFSRGEAEREIVDPVFITLADTRLWTPASTDSAWAEQNLGHEALAIELCFMTALIVQHRLEAIDAGLGARRSSIARFAWYTTRVHDPTVRNVAHALIGLCIATQESSPRLINQVFPQLLKAHAAEARSLIRDSVDALARGMTEHPSRAGPLQNGLPVFVTLLRRMLIEDASPSLATHVYSIVARNPDLFYPYRHALLPHMIQTTAKIALPPPEKSAGPDTRPLAADYLELIIAWERRRNDEVATAAREEDASAMEVDAAPKPPASVAPSSSSGAATFALNQNQRDTVVHVVLRLIACANEPVARPTGVAARYLRIFRELLAADMWPDTTIRPSAFNRFGGTGEWSDPLALMYANTLEALVVWVNGRTDEQLVPILLPPAAPSTPAAGSPPSSLQQIAERGLSSADPRLHAAVRPLLVRLFALVRNVGADDDESPAAKFVDWAQNTITQDLGAARSATATAAPTDAAQSPVAPAAPPSSNLSAALTMLHAWAPASPDRVDQFVSGIVRNLTRLAKEHCLAPTAVPDSDPSLQLIVSTFTILRPRMAVLGEQRRWVHSAILLLIEKSSSVSLCRMLLDMVRHWVVDARDGVPTVKEKASLLVKMQAFEQRHDETLFRDFLQLILDIYSDPAFARSEMTVRLESAFLLGCRHRDPVLRGRFLDIFDGAISRTLFSRLHYLIGVQSWEVLADSAWIHQATDLLLGAVDGRGTLFHGPLPRHAPSVAFAEERLRTLELGGMVAAVRKLLYAETAVTHATWIPTFAAAWACLSRKEHYEMSRFMVTLLTKDYHQRNIDRRPNNIQALVGGLLACTPLPSLPPHLVRYLGKTFNAWHASLEILAETADQTQEDEVRDMAMDAMAATYAELCEDDLFYGLWRRRCYYQETSIALSFEQNGMWQQAQQMHEAAQIKARTGGIPFTESEYSVWEDHWVMCAQKLQQWDILTELAKHEGNAELLLECAWRLSDWEKERETIDHALKNMGTVPTPRKRVFDAYMALVRTNEDKVPFVRICDDGIQLALRKWFYLPETVTDAHVPLLQVFQQFVELQEAAQIYGSLAQTTAANLDTRSQELKNILLTWRERLPNEWDDINIWSDLVAWRQHIFSAINSVYLGITSAQSAGGANAQTPGGQSSYAYRGYHETAWIINRFAHVARKHHLSDVCITSLTKIYTLPNIEIQEAFLKLREQAKCHYQNPAELTTGLEVINSTNLGYFGPAQKAEFFTIKGMFLARLDLDEEARTTFQNAVQMDMAFPKAWAEWGAYLDRLFKASSHDLSIAAHAVSCYLQAAGLYKSAKVRKLLVRILWLLSLDDSSATVAKAFETYKGEVPVWYWITFIPQLLLSLSHREAQYARIILLKIAKSYPQALYYLLRTSKEDLNGMKRSWMMQQEQRNAAARAAAAGSPSTADNAATPSSATNAATPGAPSTAPSAAGSTTAPPPGQMIGPNGQLVPQPRHPWDYVDEIILTQKTAWPLLTLSMEYFCDAIQTRFKPVPDEDIYRLVTALLNDAIGQYVHRAVVPDDDGSLPQATASNVARVAANLQPGSLHDSFEEDFVTSRPNLAEYVRKLMLWRDRCERLLDRKPKRLSLESATHWLVEYQYNKFDELEVPGQYLLHEDGNQTFVKIAYFKNRFEFARSASSTFRRLRICGHDGTEHVFMIQTPASRYCRREERLAQLFRMLNWPLEQRKESRKRNLGFHLPLAIPLAPIVRLVSNDPSNVSLADVWAQHARDADIGQDDPLFAYVESMSKLCAAVGKDKFDSASKRAAQLETFESIQSKIVPADVLKRYMQRTMASPSDLWHARRNFTTSYASFVFQSYVLSIGGRSPSRIHLSRSSGNMHSSDLLPSLSSSKPEFAHSEPVPFRFTPSLQHFIGAVGAEGLLTSAILAIAQALTDKDELASRLPIFVREEMSTWNSLKAGQPGAIDSREALRAATVSAVDGVVARSRLLSCKAESEKTPIGSVPQNQSILELLAAATNVLSLAQVEPQLSPWL